MKLRNEAPAGLLPWIQEQKDIEWVDLLVYKAGRAVDPLTGMSFKCVDAVCSACQSEMQLEYAETEYSGAYGSSPFGFAFFDEKGRHVISGWHELKCPCCGEKVTALHIGAMRNPRARYIWAMAPERDGEKLLLYFWRVGRSVDKHGTVSWRVDPWECYVFGKNERVYYSHWHSVMSSTCICTEWERRQVFKDKIFDIDIVYAPDGIESITRGTAMENSKLELYMQLTKKCRFPVVWLSVYQKHNNAENLLTAETADIVADLINLQKRDTENYYHAFNEKADLLKTLDWERVRPWEMLRMQKEDWSFFRNGNTDTLKALEVMLTAHKHGVMLKPEECDPAWRGQYGMTFLERGIDPRKVQRYKNKQKKKYPNDYCSDNGSLDYWSMCKRIGWNLNDKDVRWPQHFSQKHDEADRLDKIRRDALERKKNAEREAELREKFQKRYMRMSRYAWEHDGILIRPAASDEELAVEGITLHHCVHSYSKRHAAGDLTIFFIRRASEPDKPWFTLNFNEKSLSVTENRGLRNCARTPEVKAFEEAWLAWVRAGCKREKKKEVHAA